MKLVELYNRKQQARMAMQSAAANAHRSKTEENQAKLNAARKAYRTASDKYDEQRNKENTSDPTR